MGLQTWETQSSSKSDRQPQCLSSDPAPCCAGWTEAGHGSGGSRGRLCPSQLPRPLRRPRSSWHCLGSSRNTAQPAEGHPASQRARLAPLPQLAALPLWLRAIASRPRCQDTRFLSLPRFPVAPVPGTLPRAAPVGSTLASSVIICRMACYWRLPRRWQARATQRRNR